LTLRGNRGDSRTQGIKSPTKAARAMAEPDAQSDRREALRLVPVSRETERRLEIYIDLLNRWRKITNLISNASFQHVWTRHIADSAQLLALAADARNWVDLGSGAGFPGLVLAMQLADTAGACVHLIESDQRKCAFLREVARQTGSPAQVHAGRAEAAEAQALTPVDAVAARAFAPLPRLMEFANVFLARGAVGIFPRGRSIDAQLAELDDLSAFHIETKANKLDPDAAILVVRQTR
jgi:16S rRNA (guanine527-N7)-methyltransferase